MVVLSAFVLLVGLTVWRYGAELRQKGLTDWIVDSAGLWIQGLFIPLLQITWLQKLYQQLFSSWHHSLPLPPLFAFVLSFVIIDYLYYWNHRWLHSRWGWIAHRVHHTVTDMDVLGTSRNTLWSSFLILYVWVHGLFIFLLADPTAYLLGVGLTAALDLWRHSRFGPAPNGHLYRWLSPWLVLPQDHGWHHCRGDRNYGANLKLWDQWHGTLHQSAHWPTDIGQPDRLNLWRRLLYPVNGRNTRGRNT